MAELPPGDLFRVLVRVERPEGVEYKYEVVDRAQAQCYVDGLPYWRNAAPPEAESWARRLWRRLF